MIEVLKHDSSFEVPPTHQLYVDGSRTDTYTANGTSAKPFLTITAAINQIIANGDNEDNSNGAYAILISPHAYNENIVLNDPALVNLIFKGLDQRTQRQTLIGMGEASGYAFDSSSNNTNLRTLTVTNLSFFGNVRLKGDVNNTNFISNGAIFLGCEFTTQDNGLEITNAGAASFQNCSFTQAGSGSTTVTNSEFIIFANSTGNVHQTITLVTDGGNSPNNWSGETFVCLHNQVSISSAVVGAGSFLMLRAGTRLGFPGSSLDISGLVQAYDSFIRSNITVNVGGELNLRGTQYSSTATVTNNGTITNDGHVYYTPATPGNWPTVPTNVKTALDYLSNTRAAHVSTKTLFVDGNRADSYTEDGTILRPFKLIQSAINQVITNADNSSFAYDIRVFSDNYPENLTFNSLLLVNLSITGTDSVTGAQSITGTLSSTSNNTNLQTLTINNLTINGDVTLTGDVNNTTFGNNQIAFNNCWIRTNTNGLACTNLRSALFTNCNIVPITGNGPTFTNCNAEFFTCIGLSSNATALTLVYNSGGNKPSGLSQTFVVVENTTIFADVTVGAGTLFVTRNGVRVGSSGGSLNISGTVQAFNSFIRNNITVNSGGSLQLFATEYLGSLTNSGTVTDTGKRVMITCPLLVGGTSTTSPLTYKTTTGVGTTGADHIFQVGNNGGTEAMRILNTGKIGMGIASSAVTMATTHIHGTASTGPVLFVSNGLSDTTVFATNIAGGIEAGTSVASAKGYLMLDASNRIISLGKGSGNIIRFREGSTTGNIPIAFSGFDNRVMIGTDTDNGVQMFQCAGTGIFAGAVTVPDVAYSSSWNGDLTAPTKNAIYDKIQTIASDVLFDHFTDANNSGSSETDLYSDTIAAAQLSANGEKIVAQYGGIYTGSATATQELKVYFGGTAILDSGALAIGAVTAYWDISVTIIRVSSSVVRCSVSYTSNSTALSSTSSYTEVTGLTLANTQILKITGTSAGVGAGSDQITAKEGFVEFKPSA